MQINEEVTYKFDCILVTLEQVVMIFNMKISRRQLDGCIVWNAHNTFYIVHLYGRDALMPV